MPMGQEIRNIELTKLKLWTENPRDPINPNASDAEIIRRAIQNKSNNWNLEKMLSEIGEQYFYNDLPTVVPITSGDYVVYDGNRRVAVLKCIQDLSLYSEATEKLPTFAPSESLLNQKELPCNVCDSETALTIVEKYHTSSNKWGKLEFETFLHLHRGHPKGRLMLLNEATGGLVDRNPKLNEEYVQNNLLTDSSLNSIGFAVIDNELVTNHSNNEAIKILEDIAEVRNRDLSNARKNPRRLKDALIELNSEKYKGIKPYSEKGTVRKVQTLVKIETPAQNINRVPLKTRKETIFGGKLRPRGDSSNMIYRAIEDVYSQYEKNPAGKAYLLPIIGFSLRLFLGVVAQEYYAAENPSIDKGDDALKFFLKDIVKPYLRDKSELLLNQYSLASEWVNGDINLEAVINKWAHGTLAADNDTIIRHSKLIAEIIRAFWWKD
jgi:hypothetical protein